MRASLRIHERIADGVVDSPAGLGLARCTWWSENQLTDDADSETIVSVD